MTIPVIHGDIWKYHKDGYYIVVPTNGYVKANGECVMGRGLALQAKTKFVDLPKLLGTLIRTHTNQVYAFPSFRIFTFPVKHNWYEQANLYLIEKSCTELMHYTEPLLVTYIPGIKLPIYLPKVGCGNGKLDWDVVGTVIDNCLPADKFVVCDYK